jgi:8-amino-7-oxononanoate synthase
LKKREASDSPFLFSKILITSNLDHFLLNRLESLKKENKLRSLPESKTGIDFTSNDYLGLARSKDLFRLIQQKNESENLSFNGATGSRLLSGNSKFIEKTEHKLAGIFNAEASLIFNSGYSANQAILSSIPQRGDTILYDELAHACIKDGARLSLAQRFSFKHNDVNDLESKLKKSKGKKFVAVESIYSMDGDQCPLNDLVSLAKKYDASIILDEAHSTGIIGQSGSGLAVFLGLEKEIAVRIYTFGKAMGVHGACVAGSKTLIQYLINFARTFIYTTALPLHSIASIDSSFDYLNDNIVLQEKLKIKVQLFKDMLKNTPDLIPSNSAIQSIIIPGNNEVKRKAEQFQQAGFDVRPILSPTVKEGNERLRICLHTFNSNEEITKLTEYLKS